MLYVGIAALVLLILYAVTGIAFYNIGLKRSKKTFLNKKISKSWKYEPSEAEKAFAARCEAFRAEHPAKKLSIRAAGGLTLHAFMRKAAGSSHRWAVLVHGYMSKSDEMGGITPEFLKRGYNTLAPDLRGHGESGGKYIGMGWPDRLDVLMWIDEIIKIDPKASIVLYGVSMGAATVMMTAGEELPPQVVAAVEDCGYTSAKEQFSYQIKRLFRLPEWWVLSAADVVCRFSAKYSVYKASAIKQVKKARIPMLFIHGEADSFVPFEMVHKLYEAAECPKELYTVSGAGHAKSFMIAGDEYTERLFGFLSRVV